MLLLSSADFFFKINFKKNSFRNPNRMSDGLDPDLGLDPELGLGPDLGPNCLQRSS